MIQCFPIHGVTPVKAGVHPEMDQRYQISGWTPACAGMTSSILKA